MAFHKTVRREGNRDDEKACVDDSSGRRLNGWYARHQAVSSGKTFAHPNAFADQIIGQDLCRTKYNFVNKPTATRRRIEAWRIHHNRVRPHSALGFVGLKAFCLAGDTACGNTGRYATLENFPNFPLFLSLDDGDNSPNSSLLSRT